MARSPYLAPRGPAPGRAATPARAGGRVVLARPAPSLPSVLGPPPVPAGRVPLDPAGLLRLQRNAGNDAVTGLLAGGAPVVQRDATDVTRATITAEYAQGLSPDAIVERLRLLEREMAALDARGQRQSAEYSTLFTNRRLLRDALGAAGRSAEQEMVASTYRLPRLDERVQARLRLVIGGTRAWEAMEHREALLRSAHDHESRGMGILNWTDQQRQARAQADEALDRELAALGLSTPDQLRQLVETDFPALVLTRAKEVALGMLDQNEDVVRQELARYGPKAPAADVEGLQAADRELALRQDAVDAVQRRLADLNGPTFQHNQSRGMGIANLTQSSLVEQGELADQLELQRSEFTQLRQSLGLRFPVLAAAGYVPGQLAGATRTEVAARTGAPLTRVIDNIARVRSHIAADKMKVWNINRAVSTALVELGAAGQPILVQAVQRDVERQQRNEEFDHLLLAALAIGTTLAAGPLTPFVGAIWGVHFANQSVDTYLTESAADNVALDPEVRDISANEPSLLWLVLDVAGAVVDLGAALRVLRPAARAAMASGRLAEFASTARRVAPELAERLVVSLRRRLGGVAAAAVEAGPTAVRVNGAGRTLDGYLEALRAEAAQGRTAAARWDHAAQPHGLPEARWEPGLPIDMPNSAGSYPVYDVARPRYWRNRAFEELRARNAGQARRVPGATLDPVSGLTDVELGQMSASGRAPRYAYPKWAGQTWELEHGVPQRVGSALEELGLSRADAARLSRASDPGNVMEVTPLEHSFFDAEAQNFGGLRSDTQGAHWPGTQAADSRLGNPLRELADSDLQEIFRRTAGLDYTRTARTRALRDALNATAAERGLTHRIP